jgi:hypothetical protein
MMYGRPVRTTICRSGVVIGQGIGKFMVAFEKSSRAFSDWPASVPRGASWSLSSASDVN